MTGNIFGCLFRITTFGESHGQALGVVIDGVPPGLALNESDIQEDLDKRKPGQSEITTPRKEADKVEILSGVFQGKTLGTPVSLLIRNSDQRSQDYEQIKNIFRPGHADLTYKLKYGLRDYRGGGRSSGRETAARVAAGAVAKKIIAKAGIAVTAYTLAVNNIYAEKIDLKTINSNAVRCPDPEKAKEMTTLISKAKKEGDSLGGIIEAVVTGCPPGLGDPVFDKLEAKLGQALLSIGGVKGIEFGAGFSVAGMKGSQCNDELYLENKKIKTRTNNAGGILGGISNGEEIVLRIAVKPTPSIDKEQNSVNEKNEKICFKVSGRHDPCICPRIVPVIEAMVNITIADRLLVQNSLKNSC
ncbi:chorismate synthase [Candidatus Margulisiibacteriota bacterium]